MLVSSIMVLQSVQCISTLYKYVNIQLSTVGPWLSESLLSEHSIYPNAILNLKSHKTIWFSTEPSNDMLVWFLDLLGLLYHSTVDRIGITY